MLGYPARIASGRQAQAVFRAHGTSEYAFLVEALPSLRAKHPGEDVTRVYEQAIKAYAVARAVVLKPYPGVIESLESLKDRGCLLVGYTESMAYYSNYRLRKLGLDRILDFIYSPEDLPVGLSTEDIRRYPAEHYRLRRTVARHTPTGVRKPSVTVLQDIVNELGARAEEVVYVGDSLMKDVQMAKSAGVLDVWAKYGVAQHRPEYALLRRVTHWSDADVAREKSITHREIVPTYTLEKSFDEVLTLFSFTQFSGSAPNRIGTVVEAWKQTVAVQQHFNEIELKIRNYAVTLVVAAIGASAFALEKGFRAHLWGMEIPLGTAVLLAGLLAWMAFYGMDRWWYHVLLGGAVKHGMFIERRLSGTFPEFALTAAIGRSSPVRIWRLELHSSGKINLFYGCIGAIVLVLALLTLAVSPPKADEAQHPRPSVQQQPNSPSSMSDGGRLL